MKLPPSLRIVVLLVVLSSLLTACASTPPAPPDELANQLLAELQAGHEAPARELFARVADEPEYRDKIYPVLYGAARTRYQEGDAAAAAVLLRFLHAGYPDAAAVREALLYALFVARAGKARPDPVLVAEIDGILAELRRAGATLPTWIDLIETQQALDRGEEAHAREAYARFLAAWNRRSGDPPLVVYVDDLGRALGATAGGK